MSVRLERNNPILVPGSIILGAMNLIAFVALFITAVIVPSALTQTTRGLKSWQWIMVGIATCDGCSLLALYFLGRRKNVVSALGVEGRQGQDLLLNGSLNEGQSLELAAPEGAESDQTMIQDSDYNSFFDNVYTLLSFSSTQPQLPKKELSKEEVERQKEEAKARNLQTRDARARYYTLHRKL